MAEVFVELERTVLGAAGQPCDDRRLPDFLARPDVEREETALSQARAEAWIGSGEDHGIDTADLRDRRARCDAEARHIAVELRRQRPAFALAAARFGRILPEPAACPGFQRIEIAVAVADEDPALVDDRRGTKAFGEIGSTFLWKTPHALQILHLFRIGQRRLLELGGRAANIVAECRPTGRGAAAEEKDGGDGEPCKGMAQPQRVHGSPPAETIQVRSSSGSSLAVTRSFFPASTVKENPGYNSTFSSHSGSSHPGSLIIVASPDPCRTSRTAAPSRRTHTCGFPGATMTSRTSTAYPWSLGEVKTDRSATPSPDGS